MGADDTARGAQLAEAWRANWSYLVGLAFGMLGDIGAAEDAVQEAFARLASTERDRIDDARGWLIVVTSRICLDQIRSARSQRDRPHDATTIESAGVPATPALPVDPADRVTLDDQVRLALFVVLDRLTPALVSNPVAGPAVVLAFAGQRLSAVILLTIEDERIRKIHVIADPAKVGFLSAQLGSD